MDVVLLIGRILFAAIFIFSGSTVHLFKWREGVSYARASNVPAPELLVPASGVMAVRRAACRARLVGRSLGARLTVTAARRLAN